MLGSPQVTMPGPHMSSQMRLALSFILLMGSVIWLQGKESACSIGDMGGEDPLEEAMATHSSMLAGKSHGHKQPGD